MEATLYAKCDCDHCGNHISFPVELADSVLACPHCQKPTNLTLTAPKPEQIAGGMTAAEILRAFGPPVTRTPVSFPYQLGLVLVAMVMFLLPVLYLGLIGVTVYGLWTFVAHFSWGVASGSLRGQLWLLKIVLFVLPLVIGLLFLLFLLKPLFARRPPAATLLCLDPVCAQTLYAFIARICEAVNAPMPKRIELNCDLNAAAGFRRGLAGMMRNELVLSLGVPLMAGLNLQQFAGVIAHEFGHFTQGFGLRLSYLVRQINGWFVRVCYGRDHWDVQLAEVVEESQDGWTLLVAGAAQFCIGCTRWVLKLLLYLGHAVSCFLLRQMEYDADSYEIKVAGSKAMEQTFIRISTLEEAMKRAYKEARSTWNTSRKLPEDLPAFLLHQESLLPGPVKMKIATQVGRSRTGLFSTHPSEGDRIRRARIADEPGIFHLQEPASVLFNNFELLSREITLMHYHEDLRLNCDAANLRSMDFYTRTAAT